MVPGLTAIRPGTQYTSETLWKKKRMLENSIGSVGGMTTAAAQTETAGRQPGPWMFILDYPKPPYGLSANDRPRHWSIRSGATADIRLEVMAKVRALHIGVLEKVSVQVVWFVATKHRRDTDNLAPFMKAIFDGIGADKGVSAHLVEDDAPEFMLKPGALIRYEKGCRPHFQVTITDLGGDE